MLIQLFKNNFTDIPREQLGYEVYNGYYADNLSSTVFTSGNLLATGTTNDFTNLTTSVGANISGTDVKSAIIFGFFRAKKTGTYTFFTRSRDASYLRIDNKNVVYNNGTHSSQTVYGIFEMVAGNYYQLVIYYGNSGTGTAQFSAGYYEPDGTVIPELPLTSDNTTLTGVKYSGNYILSASSISNGPISRAFNKIYYTDDRFSPSGGYSKSISGFSNYYADSGTATTNIVGGETYRGEWLQIELPKAIRIKHFKITRRTLTSAPGLIDLFVFLGTNDPVLGWNKLFERNVPGFIWNTSNIHEVKSFDVNQNENEYKYYRVAVYRNQQNSGYAIGELLLYTEPPPTDLTSYIQDANGLTSYFDVNPTSQTALTTSGFPLLYEDASLQGTFRISPLAVYINRENFINKHGILYIESDELFNNFNGTYKNYIQLHEKPVANDIERKRFTQFSSDMSFVCELNGRLQVRFRREGLISSWRYAMVVLDVERIPVKNI